MAKKEKNEAATSNFYFEGNDESASSSAKTNEKSKTYAKRQSSEMPTIYEIAERLEITETTAPDKFDEKVRDEANPFFYEMWGLNELQSPTEQDRERIREWKDALTKKSDDEWGRTKGELLNNFNRSLNVLYQNISNQTMYEREFEPHYKKNLWRDFSVEIKARCTDKIIDVFEMRELLDWAKEHNLWTDDSSKKEVTSQIEEAVKANGARVESWEETFIRIARQKSAAEMLDTRENRKTLLKEYKKCLSASSSASKRGDAAALMRDMESLLGKYGMKFADRMESFKANYFYKTLLEKKLDISKPIPARDYYEVESNALNTYCLSKTEWSNIVKESGITMVEDAASAEMKNRIKTLEKEKKKIEAEREKSEAEHQKEIRNMAIKKNKTKTVKTFFIAAVIIAAIVFAAVKIKWNIDRKNFIEAAGQGNVTSVKKYIDSGINVDFHKKYGDTALIRASSYGYTEVVKVLLDAGASLDLRKKYFLTGEPYKYGDTALMLASYYGHAEVVKMLLEAGADFNLKDEYGATALMYASENGHAEVVKMLVEAGASLNSKRNSSSHRNTALIVASLNGHAEVVKILLEAGADPDLKNNWTALMWASRYGHAEVVKLLVEAGADINVKKGSSTALTLASEFGHREVVNFLKQHGAK